jgi:hypothetical protein
LLEQAWRGACHARLADRQRDPRPVPRLESSPSNGASRHPAGWELHLRSGDRRQSCAATAVLRPANDRGRGRIRGRVQAALPARPSPLGGTGRNRLRLVAQPQCSGPAGAA